VALITPPARTTPKAVPSANLVPTLRCSICSIPLSAALSYDIGSPEGAADVDTPGVLAHEQDLLGAK
jgi:hypothetical protein